MIERDKGVRASVPITGTLALTPCPAADYPFIGKKMSCRRKRMANR